MSEQTAKKAKLRNYRDHIMCGFVSADSQPMCPECGAILTNDSMKKVKLEHHQRSKHHHLLAKIGNILRIKGKNSLSNYPTLFGL